MIYRVLIRFTDARLVYTTHEASTDLCRRYDIGRLYRPDLYTFDLHHLQLFCEAATPDEAEAQAAQKLLAYVQESVVEVAA